MRRYGREGEEVVAWSVAVSATVRIRSKGGGEDRRRSCKCQFREAEKIDPARGSGVEEAIGAGKVGGEVAEFGGELEDADAHGGVMMMWGLC